MHQPCLSPFALGLRRMRRPLALASLIAPGLALANPGGGVVTAGQAQIGPATGSTLEIHQSSASAAINWQQFSIGSDEYVVFHQPSASATVLNRVIGGGASEILGHLTANGRVFLVNPAGVVFGRGAQVDVGGLVASTLNIADDDFMRGRYVFSGTPGNGAAVSNAGRITATPGGYVVLAGERVSNSGLIEAQLGTVALASGSTVTLALDADGLVGFSVDSAALSAAAGVENIGDIVADGGRVLMQANLAQALAGTAINNRGRVQANTIAEHEGVIELVAAGGDVLQQGVLDASGGAGEDAGHIAIRSDRDINLTGDSRITATGASGGEVRVVAERDLTHAKGSQIDVSRTGSGAGGFVELSGHRSVTFAEVVTLGPDGKLLLDPATYTIGTTDGNNSISRATLESQLKNSSSGSIFSIAVTDTTGDDSIIIASSIDGSNPNPAYGGGLELFINQAYGGDAIGSITTTSTANAITVDGPLILTSGTVGGTITTGALSSLESYVHIFGAGKITTQALNAAQDVLLQSSAGAVSTGAIVAQSNVAITAQGGRADTGDITVDTANTGDSITVQARDGIKTGNIKVTLSASANDQFLFGSVNLLANAFPSVSSLPDTVVAGTIDLITDPLRYTGVSAEGFVSLQNQTIAVYDQSSVFQGYFGGGAISTGTITTSIVASGANAISTSTSVSSFVSASGSGDIGINGIRQSYSGASAPGFGSVSIFTDNGGSISTGALALGSDGSANLSTSNGPARNTTTGNITVGTISGTVSGLFVDAIGSVGLGTTSITADDISIHAGHGDLVLGTLVSRAGGVTLTADAGRVQTNAISASGFGNSISTAAAVTQLQQFSGGEIFIAARDGITTGDLSIAQSATGTNQSLFGGIFLDVNPNADPAATGGALVTGNIKVALDAAGFTGVSSTASVDLSNVSFSGTTTVVPQGGSIQAGNILVTANGTPHDPACSTCTTSTSAFVGFDAADAINAGTITFNGGGADSNTRDLNVTSYRGGDVKLSTLTLNGSSSATITTLANPSNLLDVGNITLAGINGVTTFSANASGVLAIDVGTSNLTLANTNLFGDSVKLNGGNIALSGFVGANHGVVITATNTVSVAPGGSLLNVQAGGLSIAANLINIGQSSLFIGSESMALGTDTALFNSLPLDLRPLTAGPNAAFAAAQGVTIGNLSIAGAYLFVRAPSFASGSITNSSSTAPALAQAKVAGPLFFNVRPFGDTSNLDVVGVATLPTLQSQTVTYAFGGSGYSGDVVASKAVDVGSSNVLFATSGATTAKNFITTTGQVLVVGSAPPPPTPPPTPPPPSQPPPPETVVETSSVQNAVTNIQTESQPQTLEQQQQQNAAATVQIADSEVVDETSDAPEEESQCR